MEKSSIRYIFMVLFICNTVVSCVVSCSLHVDAEPEFNYEEGGPNGPNNWGNLKPEWAMCGKGEIQSPIDLSDQRVETLSALGKLDRDYQPSNATLKNRGHDMMLRFDGDAGSIMINDTDYYLQQAHWHSPAEHTFNGRKFDLELHMVHQSKLGRFAVVSILYKIGRADTFIQSLANALGKVHTEVGAEQNVGIIDPKLIKRGSRKYYRYVGSLTTPPCTQDVVWTIVRKVRTVTRDQMTLVRAAEHGKYAPNSRPIQPINNRVTQLYRPEV